MFFKHKLLDTLFSTLLTWNLACFYIIPLQIIQNGQNSTIYPENIYLCSCLRKIMQPKCIFYNISKNFQRILTKCSREVKYRSSLVLSEFQLFMATHIHTVWKALPKLRFSSNFEIKILNHIFWTRFWIFMWKICWNLKKYNVIISL